MHCLPCFYCDIVCGMFFFKVGNWKSFIPRVPYVRFHISRLSRKRVPAFGHIHLSCWPITCRIHCSLVPVDKRAQVDTARESNSGSGLPLLLLRSEDGYQDGTYTDNQDSWAYDDAIEETKRARSTDWMLIVQSLFIILAEKGIISDFIPLILGGILFFFLLTLNIILEYRLRLGWIVLRSFALQFFLLFNSVPWRVRAPICPCLVCQLFFLLEQALICFVEVRNEVVLARVEERNVGFVLGGRVQGVFLQIQLYLLDGRGITLLFFSLPHWLNMMQIKDLLAGIK